MADDQTNTRDSTDSALRRLAHAPPVDPDAFLHGTRAARLTPGTVIDEMFVVRERLGHGGMGVVYRAWHEALDRDVAIKLCRRQVNARETARLLKEAQATAAFSDPNIVVVHHVGTMEDQVYLVMEYVGGGTLGEWARAEPRPWRKIVGQLAAAARGLAAAHDHGLVHRDFKPENVLVGEDGRVRVSDFGLAVPFGASSADASVPGPAGDDATASATPTGPSSQQHAGTPRYMAPEQYSGDAVTPATDQFALCLVLYELLSGAHPFEGDRAAPGAKRRPSAIPRRVANRVRVAVERGLSVAPADRHASMHALVERLDTDVRWGPAAAMLGGGAAGLAAIVVASTPADDPCAAPLLEPPRWSDAARHSLRARFADSSLAAGKVLAARVERELDAYVEQWRSAERAICRDTDGEPERRRARHACLNVRKVEVASVRDLLAAGDAEALARALGTVARLPRPGACASDDLARLARAAPVEDVALGETLARANAALSVRRLDLAMEHADAALEMARDDSGRARATMMRFRVLDKRNEYAAAALEGERALQLAIRAGDDDVAAEAARLLVFTTSVGLGKPGAAHRWADRADAWLVRLGEPAHARVTLDVYRGVVLRDERKLKDAESLLRNALGRARALEPPRPDMVANILINLGSTLQRASKFEDAEAVVRETLQTITHGLGADHPIRLSALQQLSAVLLRSGRADEGIELSREVLAGYEGIYGSESPRAAAAHVNLGTTLFLNGDHAGGRRHNRIALAIYEASGDVKAQDVAVRNLSQIAIVSGDLDEARDLARRDVELCRQVDDAPNLVVAMVNLATVSGMREEHQLAYESATQAVALAADAFGPEDPARALSWLALGNTAHKVGDLEESRAAFESGVALLRATTGAADVSWGPLHAGLAEMHAQAGRHEDAIAALSEVDLSTMHRDEDRRDASLVLAESRLALGQRTQARQDARRALQYAEASGEPDGIVQAQALLDRLK